MKVWSGSTGLVHGVKTDGDDNVDTCEAPLTALGHNVKDVQIPRRAAVTARFHLLEDLEQILDETSENDALIGHSNGGYLALWATRFRKYSTVIVVNAAASCAFTLERSKGAEVFCIHSGGDFVLRLATYIPWPRWGRAGVHGLDELDDYHNVRTTGGHSEIFQAENAEIWCNVFDEWIRPGVQP